MKKSMRALAAVCLLALLAAADARGGAHGHGAEPRDPGRAEADCADPRVQRHGQQGGDRVGVGTRGQSQQIAPACSPP